MCRAGTWCSPSRVSCPHCAPATSVCWRTSSRAARPSPTSSARAPTRPISRPSAPPAACLRPPSSPRMATSGARPPTTCSPTTAQSFPASRVRATVTTTTTPRHHSWHRVTSHRRARIVFDPPRTSPTRRVTDAARHRRGKPPLRHATPAAASAFFVGVSYRLQRCAAKGERLEADFGAPESFIHHALLELGVAVQSAPWLAPYVVSVDGRMTKWCDRCALPRPAPARLAPRTVPRVPTVGHVPTVGRHVTRARLTRLNTSRRPSPPPLPQLP